MEKIVKLIMVSGDNNNNKYYHMFEQNDGTFTVNYGRVDSTAQHASYPMSQWDKKKNEKLRKGYKDVTELYAIHESKTNKGESFISNDSFVKKLIEDLQRFAKQTVSDNYNISTKNVTLKMINEAQLIIDELSTIYKNTSDTKQINNLFLKLFTVIPRKMNNVKNYLIEDNYTKEQINKLIENEQSILDTLAGQVSIEENEENFSNETNVSLLDNMGISVSHVTDANVITKIKKMMGDSSHLFSKLFEIKNFETEKRYNTLPIENEELLFHGSRNQNYIGILTKGLLIRPSGVALTGSMFGGGNYHATKAQKSIGYTSLNGSYWASGNSNVAYLLMFAVNLGKIKHVYEHTYECYNFSKSTIYPYNSVFAHAGKSLRNDEIITYDIARCTVRYLIEIKKS